MSRLERYNPNKRGSFQIHLPFYDWELSILIGAIRTVKKQQNRKTYSVFLERLENKLSRALSKVLKTEFRDLKLKDEDLTKFVCVGVCDEGSKSM